MSTEYAPKPVKQTDVYAMEVPGSLTGGIVTTFTYQMVNGFRWGGASTHGWPRELWPST